MLFICLASLLACSAAEFTLVIPDASVSEPLGSTAILHCGLSPSLNARTFDVRWYKNGDYDNFVLFYNDQKTIENDKYRGRVSLIGELDNGNVSLKLDNLTSLDGGEYTCYVKSISWYEKANINLTVKALGSTPVLSYQESGEKMNVTCTSRGWSPKPTVTWRDSAGQELPHSNTYYGTDSEDLVNVSSWMLYSRSDSEWISCTVSLNHQEMKESRIEPRKDFWSGFWKEAFISTLVLSLTVLITFAILLILIRKGLLPHCSSHKNAKAAVNSHESLQPETLPLNTTENNHESLQPKTVPLEATENTKRGISSLAAAPEPTEERPVWLKYKVSLTLDPSTAAKCLKVSRDGKSVSCEKPNSKSDCKFPHVVSKEEFGSGQHYWEVMIWDKTIKTQPKSSWCVGVTQKPHSETQKPHSEKVLRALCYEEGSGLYTNTHDFSKISTKYNMYTLGLHLNCDSRSLSFYNTDKPSHNHLHTFNFIPQGTYYAFLSPGVKDDHPIRILNQD
ncbi:butyrophilin subfamily 2 member A2-like isoform X1 [Clarias gariepinus]|uniref:butyrophilin subfamily 2 member A2-like isoform X1 n=1 Tax=Clarias gariepinus TaxID=13013 RepID=UPI00234C92C6|nr:butyrophilin subfamily 2 member A2-like isoform X1 [Clarias gariepinus]